MIANKEDKNWHLDRNIPLALIVAIAIQTAGALWWASAVNTRVDHLERQILSLGPQGEKIIRLESKVDTIASDVGEIKLNLRRNSR